MTEAAERLYRLLPAVDRLRDADGTLRALMAVLERELQAVETDIETTYDNWFIETCEEWLVPYIGEALGVRGVRSLPSTGSSGAGGTGPAVSDFSLRGYVANTLARRRRKGTAAATEALARDVTGYPCRAVEMFAMTAVSVQVNHLRGADVLPAAVGTVDVRDTARTELIGGAFDPFARTADVRPIADGVARPNLPNLGLFLFRAQAQEITGANPQEIGGGNGWYRFDPLGAELPLFNLPQPELSISSLAGPEHVPHALTRLELHRRAVTADPVVAVRVIEGGVVRELAIQVCNLADVAGALPTRRPVAGTAAVDPVLGRMVLMTDDVPVGADDEVIVDYQYAMPGRLGAGPYDRTDLWLAQLGADTVDQQFGVSRTDDAVGAEPMMRTLGDAAVAWNTWINGVPVAERAAAVGVITITDNLRYTAPADPLELPDGARLHLIAGAWPARDDDGVPVRLVGDVIPAGRRPQLVGDLTVRGSSIETASRPGGLTLNGLLIEGTVAVAGGDLERLELAGCTVTGGVAVAAAVGAANGRLGIDVRRSVIGAVTAAGQIADLTVTDSVLRAPGQNRDDGELAGAMAIDLPGAGIDLHSSTVIGGIRGRTLSADQCVLDEGARPPARSLEITVRQEGCLRFSYVPAGSNTPRRYRCQPDEALEGISAQAERDRIVARLRPAYDGTTIGHPGFYLLAGHCPAVLRTAAADGSEPGVWHHLGHSTRIANLTAALRQYLRFGLDAGAIFDR